MSVKRYDFDCYAFYDSARLSVNECEDGDYVLHSDYAALLTRHTALVEAVANTFIVYDRMAPSLKNYVAARAEVDRLIA